MVEEMVDVSVANLITEIQYEEQVQPFAVMNPKDPSKPLQALSAGPKFLEGAQRLLVTDFQADPAGFVGLDARCRVPRQVVPDFIDWLSAEYCRYDQLVMDWSPNSELAERLTESYWKDINPPLQLTQLWEYHLIELGLFRQPPSDDEAERGGRGAKIRLFRKWRLIINNREVGHDFLRSRAVVLLTPEELATTHGGRRIGHTIDRQYRLANNLGVEDWQP